jgi:hypothetical protein
MESPHAGSAPSACHHGNGKIAKFGCAYAKTAPDAAEKDGASCEIQANY